MADKTVFRPVRGLDKKIQEAEYQEGYVYFATDTKKIYLDANGVHAMPMGGNSGIYYGKKDFGQAEEGQTYFKFEASDLEINQNGNENISIPNIDDLILNLPDGCFYRVFSIDGSGLDAIITAEQLTIAGSGGGGGGSGSTGYTFTLSRLTDASATILTGSKYEIGFRAIAKDDNGEDTGNGSYEVKINNLTVKKGTVVQGDNYVEIGEYLNQRGSTTLELWVTMYVGEAEPKTKLIRYTIETTEMTLSWENEQNTTIHYLDEALVIRYGLSGNISEKYVQLSIDDTYTLSLMEDKETSLTQTYTINEDMLAAYNIKHGTHVFKLTGYAMVNGTKVEAKSISKNLMFIEKGNTNPVISLGLFDAEVTQYNTIFIPVVIYSASNNTGNAEVTLLEQGVIVDKWTNVKNSIEYIWNYTPTLSGIQVLTVVCGTSEVSKTINVKALDINNSEVSGYQFKFNASSFASNDAVKNWEDNGVTASFSDKFDWNNGGLKFDSTNNRSYFCIKAGSTMTINYPMFKERAQNNGKNFKIIFKTDMCRDYDARVLSCNFGTEDDPSGFIMNAQGSIFKSAGTLTLDAQYCEDTYIELEFDISKEDSNGIKNYVTMWMDGVPCGFVIYSDTENFTDRTNTPITIGSPDCDVHICLMKLYEKGLSNDEHLQNFIADAPNATEMIERYRRNDILDDYGQISPTKTALANPDLLVHQYTIDRMTTTKKDSVDHCTYVQYHNSDTAVLSAEEVTIKVQGTSSEKYVVAAANLDSKFTQGFITSDGTTSSGWSMDDGTAPKINYFCTKVNVASCENANNALNQEWYNLFQPYKCVLKCKNPNARDTMQFTQGVIFIQDNNQKTNQDEHKNDNIFSDTSGYLDNPFPKFYSIGQMGNSKKNTTVFHDTENPLECCIEVKDNQMPQQQMIQDLTDAEREDCGQAAKYFEFRYPEYESADQIPETIKNGWNDFVEWMAKSNPQPKYNEIQIDRQEEFEAIAADKYVLLNNQYIKIESYDAGTSTYYTPTSSIYGYDNLPLKKAETYGPYTFKGFIAENCINEETGNPWQKDAGYEPMVKGITVSKYAGTYEYDTYERRMAKMLSECEEHLVMDSILFHYLMIETHCLIDNVAKNTFWSTEDCQHWSLIKDYDNDTGDGNDNEGRLTRTYGMEVLDKLENGNSVFNAPNSVWLNFVDGLIEAQDEMYQKLSQTKKMLNGKEVSCFSKDDYLEFFEEWQNMIPERCYIEDYYRKYFRPWEVYKDTMFLEMLQGGKKQHQRKAFETYQEIYMSSKHRGGVFSSNYITLRLSGSDLLNQTIPAKTYCDCYAVLDIGQQQSHQRVKRNTTFNFVVPVDYLDDATGGMYPASVITHIGDETGGFGKLSPLTLSFSSAKKLRALYFNGSNSDEIKDNSALTTFSPGTCPMLETLWIGGLTAYTGGLDLSGCTNTKDVQAIRSTFGDIKIADNAPLETLKLYNPSALTLSNLYNLQNLEIEAIDNPSEDNPSRLLTLRLNNIDTNKINRSKEILEKALAAYEQTNTEKKGTFLYKLENVNWQITDPEEIDSINCSIDILETLLNECYPYTATGEEESVPGALTGDLEITEEAYNDDLSIDIYNKYAIPTVYPNLDIDFTGENAKLHTVQIYSGSGEMIWSRKLLTGKDVDNNFLSDGPNGAFVSQDGEGNYYTDKIYKSDTPEHTYEFTRQWQVYNNLELTGEPIILSNLDLPSYEKVQSDLIFIPQFTETIRSYDLKFYYPDEDGNFDVALYHTITADYGTTYSEIVPKDIPYKPTPDTFDLKVAYDFKGYSLLKDVETIVADNYTVTGEQSFYPVFTRVEDISKIVHEDWFDYSEYVYKDSDVAPVGYMDDDDKVPSPTKEGIAGWMINIKDGYTLKGKITIPAYHEGKPVVALGYKFARNHPKITHVFMQTDKTGNLSELYYISSYAFGTNVDDYNNGYQPSLKYFDFSTVRRIDNYGFARCSKLNPNLFSLGENTYYLGENAFNVAFDFSDGKVANFILPAELRYVRNYAFTNFNFKSNGHTLQLGTVEKLSKICLEYFTSEKEKFTQNTVVDNQHPFSNIIIYSDKYTSANQKIDNYQVADFFVREKAIDFTFTFSKGENA